MVGKRLWQIKVPRQDAYPTSAGTTKSESRYPLAHSVPSNTERASDLRHNQSKFLSAPPGCRFPLTHPLGRKTPSVQRFQPLCPGAVKVGSLGQKVVGRNTCGTEALLHVNAGGASLWLPRRDWEQDYRLRFSGPFRQSASVKSLTSKPGAAWQAILRIYERILTPTHCRRAAQGCPALRPPRIAGAPQARHGQSFHRYVKTLRQLLEAAGQLVEAGVERLLLVRRQRR